MPFSIEVEVKGLENLAATMEKAKNALDRGLQLIALDLEGCLKEEVPVDTGRLRASFHTEKLAPMEYDVMDGTLYGMYLNDGTRPHAVPFGPLALWAGRHGIPAGALWWSIFTKGTKANPYIDRAINRNKERHGSIMQRAFAEVMG